MNEYENPEIDDIFEASEDLRECLNCYFLVEDEDTICPNCGEDLD